MHIAHLGEGFEVRWDIFRRFASKLNTKCAYAKSCQNFKICILELGRNLVDFYNFDMHMHV
jgi:hypothetical protein